MDNPVFRLPCICLLPAWTTLKLAFNQDGAVVGAASRQGGGLHVACLAVQGVV